MIDQTDDTMLGNEFFRVVVAFVLGGALAMGGVIGGCLASGFIDSRAQPESVAGPVQKAKP